MQTREKHIDNLRSLVVLGLIIFHTSLLFAREPFQLKDTAHSSLADFVSAAMNIYQMPLLFLLAGFSLIRSLEKRTMQEVLKERRRRLLLPLLVGILILIPPQVYVERISPNMFGRFSPQNFSGSFFEFYPMFFKCCYPAQNLSWHHLWFVFYLFVFTLCALPLFTRMKENQELKKSANWLTQGQRLALLALPIFIIEMTLRPYFPNLQNFYQDWANNLHYFYLVLLGGWIASNPILQAALKRDWQNYFIVGITLLALLIIMRIYKLSFPFKSYYFVKALCEISLIFGLIGAAKTYLNGANRFFNFFAPLSFSFYLFHQTYILLLAFYILKWPINLFEKFMLIALGSFGLSLLSASLIQFSRLTRLLFGLKSS